MICNISRKSLLRHRPFIRIAPLSSVASPLQNSSLNNFDIDSAYFAQDIQYKDSLENDTASHRGHQKLINLLKYIPAQLEEVQKRAASADIDAGDGIVASKYGGLYLRQITIEDQQHQQAVNEYTEGLQSLLKMGRGTGVQHFKNVLLSWFDPLTNEITREIDLIRKKVIGVDRECYGPCLMLLPPEKLSVITLNTVINIILKNGNGGVRVCDVANEIGHLVKTEINLMKLKKSKDEIPKWQQDLMEVKGDSKRFRILTRVVLKRYEDEWEEKTRIKVGGTLTQFLIEVAKNDQNVPVLEHRLERSMVSGQPRIHGVLYLEEKFFEDISMKNLFHVSPRYLPMVVPPKPWSNTDQSGGYFRLRSPIVRTFSKTQVQAVRKANMPKVLDGLDALGALPWRINRDILHVVKEAWAKNLSIGELPSTTVLPMPTEEECFRVPKVTTQDTATAAATAGSSSGVEGEAVDETPVFDEKYYKFRCRRVKKRNAELHSLRSDLKLKLWVADQFADEDIYFPHNLDFRGRAYPVPQNLSHLGSDLCRGLLTFAKKKPLGSTGLWWMKVHLANLFGNNKITFEQRVQWVEKNWDEVLDSGKNALEGRRWWATAENPFQALSACMELTRAYQSADPELYESSLPVQIDGSCNGLQHYAALGGDSAGAHAVNLKPSDRPQDVYSVVLGVALTRMSEHAQIPEDCQDLTERSKGQCARMLAGKVDRKVVKQTVMTSVYGVTRIGAKAQVQMRLEEKFGDDPSCAAFTQTPEFDRDLHKASMYLANLTLASLTEIFSSAKEIMDWLATCAELVSREGHTMSWITPLGLPVIQPYRYEYLHSVQTLLQRVTLAVTTDVLPVSTNKQKSAFPPNFVHSLDASHMLLTCLRMRDRGLAFASVHDSFWTHPCDAPVLAKVLRESFVELYDSRVLGDLRESLHRRYPRVEFPPVPTRGTFNVHEVLNSDYFFH